MNNKETFKFWNIANDSDGTDNAVIELYGDVVAKRPKDFLTGEIDAEGQYICPTDFKNALESIKDKQNITIKINSCGGDVYTAIAIYNALRELKGFKSVIVDGVALSAGSVIAMAGDKIQMYRGSLMMIHGVSCGLCDFYNIQELKKVIKGMDASERAIANIYNKKTNIAIDTLREMMKTETWLTGAEAVDKGLADEIIEGKDQNIAYNAKENLLIVNNVCHNVAGMNVPKFLNLKSLKEQAPLNDVIIEPKNEMECKAMEKTENKAEQPQNKVMTIEELKKAYPDLINQIETDAIAKDRNRIKEIEEIANNINDIEMVNEAKFIKPCNASDLALRAMKNNAVLGAQYLANRETEQAQSNKVEAGAVQVEDPHDLAKANKAMEQEKTEEIAKLYSKVFK